MIKDVAAFRAAIGLGTPRRPVVPRKHRTALCLKLILEEFGELVTALTKEDERLQSLLRQVERQIESAAVGSSESSNRRLTKVADAVADLLYVVLYAALEMGIPVEDVWAEVQKSNMAKFPNGKAIFNESGKVLKPPGWKPPDIEGIISQARNR